MLLNEFCRSLPSEFSSIEDKRRVELDEVAGLINLGLKENRSVNLLFVCTHNSRRSQMAQVWSIIASNHYGIKNIFSYSGGTEITAVNIRTIDSFRSSGINVESDHPDEENPMYSIDMGNSYEKIHLFSKIIDDPSNPSVDFGVIMVCSDADQNCPIVPGATFRKALPFVDPKHSDNTPMEKEVYKLSNRVIALEMFYIFSLINRS